MRVTAVRSLTLATLLTVLALTLGACHNTTSTGTTPSTGTQKTETFTGSIVYQGSMVHPFVIAATGPISITLTDVQPLTTMAIGVSIATWDGTLCGTAITKNDNARSGVTALSGTTTAGNYCVKVYDSGNLPTNWTVSYTIQAVHY